MNQEPLPQIHLIRDTDLSVFAYELHIFAGDFLRECEFNMRSLATNTGADSIAIMGKNHIWLSDALFAYCSTADLYQMISTTEFIGARAFLFHTDRREGGHLYGDVLMMDLDTLRQDIKRNILYPCGVNIERKDGSAATVSLKEWTEMELYEKDALKSWGFSYAPNQVTEWQYHYSTMFRQWMDQAFRYMPQDLEERLNMQYMEAAQNPDMDKYRIPQGTAKQMLLYDEAPVYRLLPSGSEKIAPIAAISTGLWYENYREFAIAPEDLGALDKLIRRKLTGSQETSHNFTKTKNAALPRSDKNFTLTGGDEDWQECMKISVKKIGGAKKDLWKDRGLYADDLEAMNEREAEKFVKKDNVWKKPDYAAMLEEGIPLGVVYFIKKARDGLNASPQYYRTDDTPEKRTARQKEYIKTVRELQTVLSDVRTVEDAMRAYDRFFVDNGYLEKVQGWVSGIHYRATKKGQDNPVITNKLSNTMLIRSAEYFERNFAQKAKKEQFCVSKEQKIPKGYAIHFNDGKQTYSKNGDWKPGTYYVTKGYSILRTNFETKEAALKWVQELAKGRNKNGKIRFVPPQLAHVKRTGPDYRNGVEITGQHYLDTFGFRGGEFGNWMNQNDRQTSLNMGFEALKDLASALKISDKDIAYQGTLAIAFGARGSGNAAAHYEPLRTVINLTKMHGAGSLAHEWWHGLDDYLGTKMGAKGMLSEQPHLYAPFQKLIDTMKYKPETPEQAAKRTEAQTERTRKNAASWLDSSVLASLKRYGNEEQMETYAVLREAFLSGEPGSVEQISAFKKNVTGRVIPKSERERLEIFERMLSGMQAQEAPQIGRTETDFYRNSVRMGKECEKDGGYWDSNVEMTARAFACYIKDKLPYTSDYLAGHADCALTLVSGKDGEMEVLKAFPVGEERRAINAVFDEIIQDLKREQLLTHADVTLPLSVSELREAADGQLSMFGVGRPSVMDQLAANRPADKKSPAQTFSRKNHEPEI